MKSSTNSLQKKTDPYPINLHNGNRTSQQSWKSTLVRTLERIPLSVSCARSQQDSRSTQPSMSSTVVFAPQADRRITSRSRNLAPSSAPLPNPATVFVSDNPGARTRSGSKDLPPAYTPPPPLSKAPSPPYATTSSSSQPHYPSPSSQLHASLTSVLQHTISSIHTSVTSEITKLKNENAELNEMLARLKYERDVALKRIGMLGGSIVPATRVEGVVEGLDLRRKRKRERFEVEKEKRSLERIQREELDEEFRLEYPPALGYPYPSLASQEEPDEDGVERDRIKKRRTSTDTVYSTTETLVEGNSRETSPFLLPPTSPGPSESHNIRHSPLPPRLRHSPYPQSTSLDIQIKPEQTEPSLSWCPSLSDNSDEDSDEWSEGEGEKDMEIASQSSVGD